ncbi:DJ-1/PfpI/YhbO family deglycase/protease [Candidatus Woesebacteria bacterium]|nr:DJ-1/PfpI/YhbO family deglycase/protease [Candidatus Woesebacteria bacterium]
MLKKVIVLTADKFEDMEVFFPTFRLIEEGWQVDIAAPKKVELRGENGYELKPDKTFDEVDPKDYDLLYIPGGAADGAPLEVSKNKKAQEITKYFFENNKHVVTICHGPYLLAASDVIKGRHLTSYWYDEVPEKVKEAGGIWKDEEVVIDKNLVSSRWPMDLPAFMREVIKLVNRV